MLQLRRSYAGAPDKLEAGPIDSQQGTARTTQCMHKSSIGSGVCYVVGIDGRRHPFRADHTLDRL